MNKNLMTQTLHSFLLVTLLLSSGSIWAEQGCNSPARMAPDSRYQDNEDGTVSDLQTGYMWQKCSVGQSGADCSEGSVSTFEWEESIQQADILNKSGGLAGHTDWRVADFKELKSLVEVNCWSPSINTSLFPNTPTIDYWSSSSYIGFAKNAWYVSFTSGKFTYNHRNVFNAVRLVRGVRSYADEAEQQ